MACAPICSASRRKTTRRRSELAQLNLLHDPTCKLYAAVEMGIAVAKTDPGLAEQLYQIAKPIYDSGDARTARNIY